MHDLLRFAGGDTAVAEQLLGGKAQHHAAGVADRIPRVLQHFAQQAHAVFQRATVFVGALVAALLQEVHGQRQVVAGVDVDQIKAGCFGAQRGVAVPAPVVGDVALVHGARLRRVAVFAGLVRRCQQHFARVQVGGGRAVVREFDAGQRAVRVHLVAHQAQRRYVVLVPQARLDIGRNIARGVDLALFGADDGPAALCFDLTHGGVRLWHGVAHTVAVWYLEEAVLGDNRADSQRLEQDVKTGVAGHGTAIFGALNQR